MPNVPGTFKSKPGVLVLDPSGTQAKAMLLAMGVLYVESYTLGDCNVIVSRDPMGDGTYRWHLSIAHARRYPNWDEIKSARYLAPELADVKCMAQLLPKLDDGEGWVNVHQNTFHLHEVIDPGWEAATHGNE